MNSAGNAEKSKAAAGDMSKFVQISADQNFLPFLYWREKELAVSDSICKQSALEKKEFPLRFGFRVLLSSLLDTLTLLHQIQYLQHNMAL